jgi:hypothetical protein
MGVDLLSDKNGDVKEYAKNSILIFVDPSVGTGNGFHEHGQLRALPTMMELGINNFTFVDAWSTYKLINFNYVKFGSNLIDSSVFPICQFISQEIEFASDLNITEHLLNSALSAKKACLVLVLDSARFCLKNNQDGKPMIEDWDLSDSTFEYKTIFPEVLRSIGIKDAPISLTVTCNLVFHRMAQLYLDVLGVKPKRLSSLFDYEAIPSTSYAWDILKSFANRKTQLECHPYVHSCLRPWIETDISRTVENILEALQRCGFDPEKVQKLRKKRMLGEV